jgi:hypothetical protein
MSVKITWKQVLDDAFKDAVVALSNDTEIDKKVGYRAAKLASVCDQQMKYIREGRNKLLLGYTNLGEDGKPLLDPKSKQPVFNSPTAGDEFKDAFKKLCDETEIEVKIHKFPYGEVVKVKELSGLHLLAIQDLIDGMPEDEA